MYKQKSFYYGLLIAVLGIFLVAASVFSWTEPSTAPPTNPPTFSPPLNTGSAVETKSGGLNILGRIGAGTASVDTNYRITTSGGGIKAESTNQPAGYFNSATGYGLLVNTGNVGIGILTPGAKLEVAGQIKITGGSPGAGKVLTSDANGLATWGTVSGTLPSGVSGQTLRHDGTNWVANSVIFNNGTNVGIGTAPTYKLHVYTGTTQSTDSVLIGSSDYHYISLFPSKGVGQHNPLVQAGDTGIIFSNGAAIDTGALVIGQWSNSARGIRIDSSGNVGIGITNPATKLNVVGNIRNSAPSQGYLELSGDLPTLPANTYPTLKTNYTYMYFSAGGLYSAYMSSAGVWTANSSREIKENFVEVDPQEILTKIEQLPMTQWNFKNENPSIKHIAPIAEDFYALFGLNGNDNKMISNIDPSGVALVGVKALSNRIQELEKTIKEQQQQIDGLKTEIEKLKQRN